MVVISVSFDVIFFNLPIFKESQIDPIFHIHIDIYAVLQLLP